jgi:O-antigen ligase/polysaccharide polymerase Wzy-like membrane protein
VISYVFRAASRWIFFTALIYAPWAYGGTTSASIQITNWLLLAALILWALELIVSRRKPGFPRLLLFLACALIGIGGWMVFNAKSIYDSDFRAFVPVRNFAPLLAGSVDYAISGAWMMRGALLLGAILFVADLSQSNRWLLRLWYMIGLVGGSIAFLGLLQKATGARMIFWQPPPHGVVGTFFATYYYHGNAGAFLNLVWPLTAGLAIRAFTKGCHPGMRAVWISAFILTIAAVLANTSRMAQLVALLLLVAICLQFGATLVRRLSRTKKSVAFASALAILLTLIVLAQTTHLEQPLNRWQSVGEQIPNDARWRASRVAMGALLDAGFFGFGPGTFRVVFPSYNSVSMSRVPGTWRFLHEDYLQTVLEWGWLGSSLWALLFFGGITTGIRSYNKYARSEWTPRRRLLEPLVIIALVGVALHALVDFPFQIASIQLYVATYLGLCWGSSLWRSEETRRQESDTRPQKSEIAGDSEKTAHNR